MSTNVLEVEAATGANRRVLNQTPSAEVWIAYLHLVKAKQSLKEANLTGELDAVARATMDLIKRMNA